MVQLVERPLPATEVRGSILVNQSERENLQANCNLENTKYKEKRPGMGQLGKTKIGIN